MKHKSNPMITKFGHRTEDSIESVLNTIHSQYSDYLCVATYNLGNHRLNEIEFKVEQFRRIINIISGNLAKEKPEFYNIEPEKIVGIFKAISNIQENVEELNLY